MKHNAGGDQWVTVITCDTVPVCSGHMNAASMMTAQSHCCYGNCAYILLTDHAYISSATCPNAAFLCQRKLLELLWCMGRSQQVVYLTALVSETAASNMGGMAGVSS